MKQKLIMILSLGTAILLSCCSSVKNASLGAGATPGKDYVTNLRPSPAARQYFAQIGNKSPIETLTRANAGRSKSGVRFVANDGILIPAGVTIQFYNKGYCMDPKLPAPVSNEEYQLVPTSALIPSQLQGIYQNLVKRAAAGDTTVKSNMQGLVWALRTAGTEGSYAARLSSTQKRILDSCSSRPGEFERVHNSGLATGRLVGELWKLADSAVNVRFGNRTWKPSYFSSAGAFNSAINSQLDSLISMGSKLPIPRTGFNYGEPEPGIYTDINGAGLLAFNAKIANSTNKDFIFYPSNYVGQVGSGSVLSAVSFAASSSVTQRQRVTMGPIDKIEVIEDAEPAWGDMDAFDSLSYSEKEKLYNIGLVAESAYLDEDSDSERQLQSNGYDVLNRYPNPSGMSIVVLRNKNDNNIYIGFAGTKIGLNSDTLFDLKRSGTVDDKLVRGRFKAATELTKAIMKQYPNQTINIIGHSLGGSTVQHVLNEISSSRLKGFTVNPFVLPGNNGIVEDPRLVDIVHQGDFAQWYGNDSARRVGRGILIRANVFERQTGQHSMAETLEEMREQMGK